MGESPASTLPGSMNAGSPASPHCPSHCRAMSGSQVACPWSLGTLAWAGLWSRGPVPTLSIIHCVTKTTVLNPSELGGYTNIIIPTCPTGWPRGFPEQKGKGLMPSQADTASPDYHTEPSHQQWPDCNCLLPLTFPRKCSKAHRTSPPGRRKDLELRIVQSSEHPGPCALKAPKPKESGWTPLAGRGGWLLG